MLHRNLFLAVLFLPIITFSQKLYIIPNFDLQYSGLSFMRNSEKNADDFKPSVPLLNYMSSIDIIYKPQKLVHKITLEYSRLGDGFKITNKFMSPADPGILSMSDAGAIQHFILSYSLGIESKNVHNPLGNLKLRYTGSLGMGIGFNRSKKYYKDLWYPIDNGLQDDKMYMAYLGTISRTGMGFFSIANAGFDVISRKNKRVLSFSLFYDKGFSELIKFNIHYQYGYFNDPSRQIDVPNQILRSRGTSFGLKIGVPIKILK